MSLDDTGRVRLVAPPSGKTFERRSPSSYSRSGWDDGKIELLKKLWADGLSARQCAGQIGGVTRSAVIGKVHRLGLALRGQHRGSPANKVVRKKKVRNYGPGEYAHKLEMSVFGNRRGLNFNDSKHPVPIAEPFPPRQETDVARVSFIDLDEAKDCKFICTDEPKGPYEPQFCGQPRVDGLPYCTVHAQRCYGAPPPRKRLGVRLSGAVYGGAKRDVSRLDAVKEFTDAKLN